MSNLLDVVVLRAKHAGLGWWLWLGLVVSAQAKTCDELRAEIAAGMDATGMRGYTLQVVPTGTPLVGAKVVGSCAGGASKVVYRRFAEAPAPAPVPDAPPAMPAPATPVQAAPAPAKTLAPAPASAPAASTLAARVVPSAAAVPIVRVASAPQPQPVPVPHVVQASQAAATVVAPVPALVPAQGAAEPAATVRAAAAEVAVVASAVVPAVAAAASKGAGPQQSGLVGPVPEALLAHWPWLGGLLLLPVLYLLRNWRGPGLDAAGLPRGPRL